MRPPHPQGPMQYPDLESNQNLDLRRVQCDPLHHRDKSARARGFEPHAAVLEAACSPRSTLVYELSAESPERRARRWHLSGSRLSALSLCKQGVRGELNPPLRRSQRRVPNRYTTNTIWLHPAVARSSHSFMVLCRHAQPPRCLPLNRMDSFRRQQGFRPRVISVLSKSSNPGGQ